MAALPIMHSSHWPADWSDPEHPELKAYRNGFITGLEATAELTRLLCDAPAVALGALGDSDAAVLGFDHLSRIPGVSQHWLQALAARSGFRPNEYQWARSAIHDSLQSGPAALMTYGWPIAERVIHAALSVGPTTRQRIDVHAIYHMQEHGRLREILNGHRVLVVSGYADEVADRLSNPDWQTRHNLTGFEIAGAIQVPGKFQPKLPHWPAIRSQYHSLDWTLALLFAGGLSFPLANEALQLDRRAIDLGQVDLCILGGTHPHTRGFESTGRVLSNEGNGL